MPVLGKMDSTLLLKANSSWLDEFKIFKFKYWNRVAKVQGKGYNFGNTRLFR